MYLYSITKICHKVLLRINCIYKDIFNICMEIEKDDIKKFFESLIVT